ncbi:MAG: polysaccharide export protein [Verrucomicrobiae bacterium]|nr:polysaccharide export protein [Verrucomicrobiae bacterium]
MSQGMIAWAATVAAVMLTGCAVLRSPGDPVLPPEAGGGDWQQSAVEGDSTLVAGDVIALSFAGAPELDQPQRIRPDGKVTLPLLNDVTAAGKRISDFQDELRELYTEHLKDDRVTVALQQTANAVYLSGDVGHPGKIPLDRPMTVIEAIMEGGGFTDYSDMRNVTLLRREQDQQHRYKLDLSSTFSEPSSKVTYVKPFDVIHVGTRRF